MALVGWSRSRGAGLLLAGVALVSLAMACRQIVGIGDEPPGSTATPAAAAAPEAAAGCGLRYQGQSCEACLENRCCTQARECANSPACGALESCYGSCKPGDFVCRSKCTHAHLIGPDPREQALAACLASDCAPQCSLECGAIGSYVIPDAAGSCQSCVLNNTCALETSCVTDPACAARAWCGLVNPWPDRRGACDSAYDAGVDAYAAVTGALLSSCATDCAWGNQWYCVGVGQLGAPPQHTPTAMTLQVQNEGTSAPVPGVAIDVCDTLSTPCSHLSGTTTDDGGMASVAVPRNTSGFGSSGLLSLSEAGIYPELYYWGFPLSEATVSLSVPVVDAQALQELFVYLHVNDDPSRGHLAVLATDCLGTPSPGARFSVSSADSETQVFYLNSGKFVPGAATDKTGTALIVNVPAGSVDIQAVPLALGNPSSIVSAYVAAGTITALAMPPNQ